MRREILDIPQVGRPQVILSLSKDEPALRLTKGRMAQQVGLRQAQPDHQLIE